MITACVCMCVRVRVSTRECEWREERERERNLVHRVVFDRIRSFSILLRFANSAEILERTRQLCPFDGGRMKLTKDHFREVRLRERVSRDFLLFLLCILFLWRKKKNIKISLDYLQRAISRLFKHKFTSLAWCICCIAASVREENL